MKKMTFKILKAFIVLMLLIVIGYMFGDMTESSLEYVAGRGSIIKDGMIVLICFLIRYGLDRSGISKNDGKGLRIAVSALAFNMITYLAAAVLLIVIQYLYLTDYITAILAIPAMTVIITLLFEKNLYIECSGYKVDFDDGENEHETEKDEELNDIGSDDEETETEDESENKVEYVKESEKESGEESESDEEGADDRVSENGNDIGRKMMVQFLMAAGYVLAVMVPMLSFGNIFAHINSKLFYLVMVILSVLSVGIRAAYDILWDSFGKKNLIADRLGFVFTVVMFTVFLCTYSALIGLVYLLGAFLVAVIVHLSLS